MILFIIGPVRYNPGQCASLSRDDSEDKAISENIIKARKRWGQIHRLLSRDQAQPKTMARFYLAVVQAVLLHGSETWVLSQCQLQRLEHFHARCARHISHRNIHPLADGTWEHPHMTEVLDLCGISTIQTYIAKRKTNLLSRYAEPHSTLYHHCLVAPTNYVRGHHLTWW